MATQLNDCGCCEGITAVVPEPLQNRPGLSQVSYRIGRHGDFLDSALAALSDPESPTLRSLTTREPDDFTIALLDGWASVADVLTFYQERIANESWLRSATERDSVVRLAQLIGYRLKPGVAAETPLAFLLDETPGAPSEVAVAIGTKVQSVPGANETPQTFETSEALDARREWNTLQPALTTPAVIQSGLTELYLQGTATNLQTGDAILIVGDERAQHPTTSPDNERWDFRLLLSVTPDAKNNRTHITWEKGLGKGSILPAAKNVKVHALRQRAARFGHNAPDPALITKPGNGAIGTWSGFDSYGSPMDLDAAYPKVVPQSWTVFTNTDGYVELYKITAVVFHSRSDFAISSKATRITLDETENLNLFGRRETAIFAQSEELATTSGPLLQPEPGLLSESLTRDGALLAPIEGAVVRLGNLIAPLAAARKIIVTGKLLRGRAATSLVLTSADGLQTAKISSGDSLTMTTLPVLLSGKSAKWTLRNDQGFEGTVTTSRANFTLVPATKDDPTVSELATVQSCSGEPTTLTLENSLTHLFDRTTVTIAANVAAATNGETVTEVLGSGNASQPNQSFKLKQTPLTYIRSTAPSGAESTLQIRVNDLLWHETPTLFAHTASERIFTTELADDGTTTADFGDGIRGARIPSGSQNIKATYRRGIGLSGLVRAGQLSTLLTRPPGLKSVLNPLGAEGADDPETFANAQQNAPLTVLTLDRVVSLEDYEDFSRTYSGIAKALATWTWDGRTRGVFLTVAGPQGATVADSLGDDLITAILQAGDPFVPLRIVSYTAAHFRLSAQIKIDPDYDADLVLAAALETLRATFAFERRSFGQPVALSEVIALLQSVAGVIAVNLKSLYRSGEPAIINDRLEASLPNGGDPNSLGAAELLTLDPAPVNLEAMP